MLPSANFKFDLSKDLVARIYVVDDCCPDQSGALVRAECRDPRVVVVQHTENQGVGGAVMSGYRAALADIAQIAPLPHPAAATPVAQPSANVLSGRVAPLLQQLLDALAQDNPGPSAPVLKALGSELPGSDVAMLADLIDSFDFRGAEHATRMLAQRLHLALPEPFDATRD